MRGRFWVAALAAASPILLFGAVIGTRAFAQATATAEDAADPNAGGATPAEQAAQPEAMPAPAGPAAASAPAEGATEPAGTPPATTTVQTVAIPAAATPVVEAIRAQLADPALRAKANPNDLAALLAFYNGRSEPVWTTDMGFSREGQDAIDEILGADDWGLSSATFSLPSSGKLPSSVDDQARFEIELDLAVLKYARHARGGRTDPARLSKLYGMTPTLRDPKVVLTEIAAAGEPDIYLQSLHPKHEQFQLLRQALVKARGEGEAGAKSAKTQKIVVNMERWRWMPEDLGSLYVLLNIPAFDVHVVRDGKPVYADKIVVGELKYATPVFAADLQSVVFNPEWTVPPTIVRENLLPSLRGGGGFFGGGTAVLKKHELNVYYNGKRVDPSSINWTSVNMAAISFRQAPSPKNVLGKVKFVYPNPYSVYMHDTIKKGLFDKELRAEGHHCPRVGNPGKIAAVILAQDQNMPQAEVDKLLASGYNSGVKLNHRVRVLTAYFTAVADDQGKVTTHADLYRIDPPVAAALLGSEARPEAVADNTAPAVEPKPKPQAQPKPSTVGSAAPAPAAGFAAAQP
ncbi:MAG: L,D-transpeptidase family protein [Methyloceanibacter sp.]